MKFLLVKPHDSTFPIMVAIDTIDTIHVAQGDDSRSAIHFKNGEVLRCKESFHQIQTQLRQLTLVV